MILASSGSGVTAILVWIVVLIVVFYFLTIRPQNKEQKRKQQMMNEMAIGDTVLTTSGFYGTVIDIQEDMVIIEFGSNRNCRIPMQKAAIADIEKPQDSVKASAPAAPEEKKSRKDRKAKKEEESK